MKSQNKKKPSLTSPEEIALLKSDFFKKIILVLEDKHPRFVGLRSTAGIEQRALKQAEEQGYEIAVQLLKRLSESEKQKNLTSTYE